ncbi:MAG: bifunctional nuclease family protein [Geobacteraceae bacterium]|nr:bifunctional nuclease family protein [Geobacteraceae bacterium]
MYLEMTVFGFTMDSLAGRPVVILKDAKDSNTVPIWLSTSEALSIAAELMLWDSSGRSSRKDLMTLLLENTGTEIGSIVIEGLSDGVFTALVMFLRNGEELPVAVRPCEAIITALKYKMPIRVAEEVLQRASVLAMSDEELARENNVRRFTEFLENLDPATLGKYPM